MSRICLPFSGEFLFSDICVSASERRRQRICTPPPSPHRTRASASAAAAPSFPLENKRKNVCMPASAGKCCCSPCVEASGSSSFKDVEFYPSAHIFLFFSFCFTSACADGWLLQWGGGTRRPRAAAWPIYCSHRQPNKRSFLSGESEMRFKRSRHGPFLSGSFSSTPRASEASILL